MYRYWHVFLFSVMICSAVVLTIHKAAVGEDAQANVEQSDGDDAKLELRYAETFLRLSEAKVRRAEALNRRVANTISRTQIKDLQLNVALAKQLLTSVQREEARGRSSVFVRLAELAVVSAESKLAKANAVRKKAPTAISEGDHEVMRFEAGLAKLNLAIGKRAMDGSTEDELRWKIGLLYEEVLRLRDDVNQLKRR